MYRGKDDLKDSVAQAVGHRVHTGRGGLKDSGALAVRYVRGGKT